MAKIPALLLSLGLAVGGCAQQGDFPSLAPRPIEQPRAATGPVAPTPAPDPAMRAKLQAAVTSAKAAQAAFDQALGIASAAASKAGAYGSDSWVAAQVAVARLERTREPVQVALTGLTDQQRLALLSQSGDDQIAVAASMAEVTAIDQGQAKAVQGLLASLKSR